MNTTSRILPFLLCAAAVAQTAPPKAEFEVASIKPSGPPVAGQVNAGVKVDGAQVHASFLAIKDYIQAAYKVKHYQVIGPDWLGTERYEVDAKLPAGATREQVPEMIQSLLAERFQLKFHRETKEFPVYGLVVAKGGLKLEGTPYDEEALKKDNVDVAATGGQGGSKVSLGHGSSFAIGSNKIEVVKMTTEQFADLIARFTDKPVVDMTDLKGKAFTFTLEFTPEEFRAMMIRAAVAAGYPIPPEALKLLDGVSEDSLFAGLQRVGLKLENRKAPLEVLVIDNILKSPVEN